MAQTIFLNYINAEFVPAQDGATLAHIDPSSGLAAATLPDSDVLDVVFAIQSANKALAHAVKTASETTISDRSKMLSAIADLIEKRADDFALAQQRDLGTKVAATKKYSVPRAVAEFRHHANLLTQSEDAAVSEGSSLRFTSRLPIGIVACITPASDPLGNLASRIAPALAAGNAVIVKPSRYTPETAELFARILHEVGVPPGFVSVIQGRGEQAGDTLARHPGVSTIAFVGSSETGRKINAVAAEMLKRTHLALSSRNPVLVFNGVDIPKTVSMILEACLGSHPSISMRGSRLFIQEAIYKEFLEVLKTQIELKQPELGPLMNQKYFAKYQELIDLASKQNGKILIGGPGSQKPSKTDDSGGFFVAPTVIFDLTNCSTLQQEEIVGPFMNATSFKYQHDALKHANTSPYGQVAYVFEADSAKAKRVAAKLEVGQVIINSGEAFADPKVVTEGLKQSGHGFVGGRSLFEFFSRKVSVTEYPAN